MALSTHGQVMFLETFIESTSSLPPELQRILNTIKALDDRCVDLSEAVHAGVQRLLQYPPWHKSLSTTNGAPAEAAQPVSAAGTTPAMTASTPAGSTREASSTGTAAAGNSSVKAEATRAAATTAAPSPPPLPDALAPSVSAPSPMAAVLAGAGPAVVAPAAPRRWTPVLLAEYDALCHRVEQDQQMLAQFADEKVQLAQQAHDLVELHALSLEQSIQDFEGDLNASGLADLGLDAYMPLPPAGLDAGRMVRSASRGLEDFGDGSLNGFGGLQAQTSGFPTFGSIAPLPPPAKKSNLGGTGQRQGSGPMKRPREAEGTDALGTGAMGTGAGGGHGSGAMSYLKRKLPNGGGANSGGTGAAVGVGLAMPSTSSAMQTSVGLEGDVSGPGEYEQEEVEVPHTFLFINQPPPGLRPSASQPQCANGRLLYQHDITPALEGRHAELYWPPDDSWYLIEIQAIFMDTSKAQIVYTTGESEELDLMEIAKDQHMKLVPQQAYQLGQLGEF